MLFLYVNGMLLIGSFLELVYSFIQVLSLEFLMKDLEQIYHFLGVAISPTVDELHLSQTRYACSILDHAQMLDC